MTLQEQINADVISAMKAKDEVALRALRGLKSALLLAASEPGANGVVSDESALKIFMKLAKQRKESLDIFKQNNREDLAKVEQEELTIIERYLPKQMGEDEIRAILQGVVTGAGATSAADFGKVMPLAMKALAGKADGKVISEILKQLLA
ncbi:MAG: glutamyl-tRNA amidotransferase [Bacteroidetes bacterium B1(2017)]|nr:MAG: glutamyl-tRNA amidotransferase [Bacteroidetes bacterium B1(2017)]